MTARAYSLPTLRLLWGKSAGRCNMPDCRIDLFADGTDHDPAVSIGDVAHVAAASDDGPRADLALTAEQRNAYENLILLCKNCHWKVDQQKRTFTVDRLLTIKREHEGWVQANLPESGQSRTPWKLVALIDRSNFDEPLAERAVRPDSIAGRPAVLTLDDRPEDWAVQKSRIRQFVEELRSSEEEMSRLAIFPLASVSSCVALGHFLTDRPRTKLFQYHRDSSLWDWPQEGDYSTGAVVTGQPQGHATDPRPIAVLVEVSAHVASSHVEALGQDFQAVVRVSVPTPTSAWLQREQQLVVLGAQARSVFEYCALHRPECVDWHLLIAAPAPAAVKLGQQISRTMMPRVHLYEFEFKRDPAYLRSIVLNE
jgi:hypothetical protein